MTTIMIFEWEEKTTHSSVTVRRMLWEKEKASLETILSDLEGAVERLKLQIKREKTGSKY